MSGILAGCRILVVEDEMMVLANIELALDEMGCTSVCAAATIPEALALLDGRKFDAAMLDVNLNGERSYPVADALARHGIPFVFSTGYGDHGDRAEFADRPLLRKPYVRSALVAALAALVTPDPVGAAA
jgi:CheY-like chemotaxis protein